MPRGRSRRGIAAPATGAGRGPAAEEILREISMGVPGALIGEAEVIIREQRAADDQYGAAAAQLEGAGALVEAAVCLAQAGQLAWPAELLAEAAERQTEHLAAIDRAFKDPGSVEARRLWEHHSLGPGDDFAPGRSQLRRVAHDLEVMIQLLRKDAGSFGTGVSSQAARLARRRAAVARIGARHLRRALVEGHPGLVRALVAGCHRLNDNDAKAVEAEATSDQQLRIAAALARAAEVDGGRMARMDAELRIDDIWMLEESDLRDRLGERALGPLDGEHPTRGGCRHPGARWEPTTRAGHAPDGIGLVCRRCQSRLALVPAHRLPVRAADPGADDLDLGNLVAEAIADEQAYLLTERRHRALLGQPDPGEEASFRALREAEGVVEDLDPGRVLEAAARRAPARAAGDLRRALSARR